MFNITKEVHRLQQLKHTKVYGLSYKRKLYDSKVQHVDGEVFEIDAEQEAKVMLQGFHNRSRDFGKRLSKRKGQKHHPGGGFAGHSIKGV